MRRAVIIAVALAGLASTGCARGTHAGGGCRVSSAQMMIEFMQQAEEEALAEGNAQAEEEALAEGNVKAEEEALAEGNAQAEHEIKVEEHAKAAPASRPPAKLSRD